MQVSINTNPPAAVNSGCSWPVLQSMVNEFTRRLPRLDTEAANSNWGHMRRTFARLQGTPAERIQARHLLAEVERQFPQLPRA